MIAVCGYFDPGVRCKWDSKDAVMVCILALDCDQCVDCLLHLVDLLCIISAVPNLLLHLNGQRNFECGTLLIPSVL